MSMFEDKRYRWRETYFVAFHSSDRPMLETVRETLSQLSEHYSLTNLSAGDDGLIDSLTLISPEDFAALDICYIQGPEVLEQGAELAEQMRPSAVEPGLEETVKRVRQCDARFDVLHFEEVPESREFPEEEDEEEMLDPGALLLVLGVLAKLTGGIAIDPQSGTVLSDDD